MIPETTRSVFSDIWLSTPKSTVSAGIAETAVAEKPLEVSTAVTVIYSSVVNSSPVPDLLFSGSITVRSRFGFRAS